MDEEGVKEQETSEGEAAAAASPLSTVWPGEAVMVGGRQVWVKPWGVKALMTEVPGLVGSLMGKLAPVFEAVKNGAALGSEDVLRVLMTNAGQEVMDFVCKVVKLSPAEVEAMTASEFVSLLRATVRQNADFFDQVGALYNDLGRPIGSALGGSGSQSS